MANHYKIFPIHGFWKIGKFSDNSDNNTKFGVEDEGDFRLSVRGTWSLDKVKELMDSGLSFLEVASQFCKDCDCHRSHHYDLMNKPLDMYNEESWGDEDVAVPDLYIHCDFIPQYDYTPGSRFNK